MILKPEAERLSTLDEARLFVAGGATVDFTGAESRVADRLGRSSTSSPFK